MGPRVTRSCGRFAAWASEARHKGFTPARVRAGTVRVLAHKRQEDPPIRSRRQQRAPAGSALHELQLAGRQRIVQRPRSLLSIRHSAIPFGFTSHLQWEAIRSIRDHRHIYRVVASATLAGCDGGPGRSTAELLLYGLFEGDGPAGFDSCLVCRLGFDESQYLRVALEFVGVKSEAEAILGGPHDRPQSAGPT